MLHCKYTRFVFSMQCWEVSVNEIPLCFKTTLQLQLVGNSDWVNLILENFSEDHILVKELKIEKCTTACHIRGILTKSNVLFII